jgi:hypothetical protein
MALRGFREIESTNNAFVVTGASERGGVLSVSSGNIASYATEASGSVPLGILLTDIEDINSYNRPQPLLRSVAPLGSQVGICVKGEVETDFLDPAVTGTINAGQVAYLSTSGWITTNPQYSDTDLLRIVSPVVGVFTSGDHGVRGVGLGYARVKVDIQQGAFSKLV